MTLHSPSDYREILAQTEVHERIANGHEDLEQLYYPEALSFSGLSLRRPLKMHGCYFSKGFTLKDSRILQDISIEGSVVTGECLFQSLLVAKILNLTNIDASGTWYFGGIKVAPTDNADIWISFMPGTIMPQLETEDEILLEMFARLARDPTELVAYSEVREELR